MQYRDLGQTGMRVSLLGLGTVKLGRNTAVHYPDDFQVPDDHAAARLLDCAKDLGINLLDTAPAYGASEATLGRLLRDQRSHWLLSSKVGESFADGRSSYDFRPDAVQNSVKQSLQRLHTDRLDIVLIHSDGNDLNILNKLGTLDCLFDLKDRGWIRAVGISHKTEDGGRRAIELNCDVVMATLNLTDREQLPVIEEAERSGCGVLIKKALQSGNAGIEGLRFAASQAGVSSVIVGTISEAHLQANSLELESL